MAETISSATLREQLTNAVAGHMPASGFEQSEPLVRGSARWGFDQIVAPLIDVLDEIYQLPGIADCLGDELHERLRAALAGEL